MHFKIVGPIKNVATIAAGTAVRERKRLWKAYGKGRWRKLKGVADVKFDDGTMRHAEVHWYEAHGIGKRDVKIKTYLDKS